MDEWKDDFLPRLKNNTLYKELHRRCIKKDSEVIATIDTAVSYAVQRTKCIIMNMGEYTLHDEAHLFRVLNLMELLLTKDNISKLSVPELMLLILSAFFHDIGMAPNQKLIDTWKKAWDETPEFEDKNEEEEFNKFKRYYLSRHEQENAISDYLEKGDESKANTIKGYLISEYIRQTHAVRCREIIDKGKILNRDGDNKIKFREQDLTVELANICHSHNEDASKLLEFDKNMLCGQGIFACLPLVGVILRLADILDFDAKRTPPILFSHLYIRNPISIKEWEKHRSVRAWNLNPEIIQFSAKCSHPAIEAAIHEFCDIIDHELSVCNNILTILNEFNKSENRNIAIKLPFKINREKIETEKDIYGSPIYIYRDTRFTLSKRQVIDLLMGTQLYGDPEVALRELLQNSIDACLLRKVQEDNWGHIYIPEIIVKYNSQGEDETLEVIDNGTGMDQEIIDKYYTKVGSSFYTSTEFENLKIATNSTITPTSRFGIGILSCFMVSDTLIVDTMRLYSPQKSSDAINMTVEGQDSIFWIRPGQRNEVGTSTKLILRKGKNPWGMMTPQQFIKSVDKVIPNPPFKITIQTNGVDSSRNENSFRDIKPLSLKDYSWNENDNIKNIEINFGNESVGIIGSCLIAILEGHGSSVAKLEINSKDISVDNETYSLDKHLELAEDTIILNSTTISLDENGGIKKSSSTQWLAQSKSQISLHGIIVESDLFPSSWKKKNNQAVISWPLPMILIIDVCGTRDLDLNSSRTEIIKSEKWDDFEEELAYLICDGIKQSVSSIYWETLSRDILSKSSNSIFLLGLNKVK